MWTLSTSGSGRKRNIKANVSMFTSSPPPSSTAEENIFEMFQTSRKIKSKSALKLFAASKSSYFLRKFALLDNLLIQERNGLIDHEGIREEVDTLTFEGFDSTSTAIIFTLFLLGQHQDIQQKVYEELSHVMTTNDMTLLAYNNFKYLECVIKESLRLYPPLPYISRAVTRETKCRHLILPKNSEISIHIFDIHRDPSHFPDPEKFDPDRFLPENSRNRHPFAYIPFSAGMRNCIGQRFAMLEVKIFVATIVKEFCIKPITKRDDLQFEAGLILRSKCDLFVRFETRK